MFGKAGRIPPDPQSLRLPAIRVRGRKNNPLLQTQDRSHLPVRRQARSFRRLRYGGRSCSSCPTRLICQKISWRSIAELSQQARRLPPPRSARWLMEVEPVSPLNQLPEEKVPPPEPRLPPERNKPQRREVSNQARKIRVDASSFLSPFFH